MVIGSFDLPKNNIAEITLIGTSGGYGESVVIHLGDQNWVVVDSCQDPVTKTCLPLDYLVNIGVNVEKQVKMVICTHWHSDHIMGLSELVEKCKEAKFCFAPCSDLHKFQLFVGIDQKKIKINRTTEEFSKCLNLTSSRGKEIIRALQDRNLLNLNFGEIQSTVFSLSPSDATLTAYDFEISTLIKDINPNNRILKNGPNSKSVALLIHLGKHKAILGADLEVSKNKDEGWINIIDNSQVLDKDNPASFFKVPHHGSENGYNIRIWKELLLHNPVAKLTPYSPSKLPRKEMVKIFEDHTKNLFITSSNIETHKAKARERSLEKAIKEYRPNLFEVKYNQGLIRSRIQLDDVDCIWSTDTYGPAYQVIN